MYEVVHTSLLLAHVDVNEICRRKEGRSEQGQAKRYKTKQSNTTHPREPQSPLKRKMSCLRWDSNPQHSTHVEGKGGRKEGTHITVPYVECGDSKYVYVVTVLDLLRYCLL